MGARIWADKHTHTGCGRDTNTCARKHSYVQSVRRAGVRERGEGKRGELVGVGSEGTFLLFHVFRCARVRAKTHARMRLSVVRTEAEV